MIRHNAEKCGMSVSQFLILRGLGYEPQPFPPAVYYHFIEKLDSLQDQGIPAESKQQISALTNEIRKVLVEMKKEDRSPTHDRGILRQHFFRNLRVLFLFE